MTSPCALTRLDLALRSRTFLKVDAGLRNHRFADVLGVVAAACAAGADAIDLAADLPLLQRIRQTTSRVLFVSSTEPAKLIGAAGAGADVLELGHYGALHAEGRSPSHAQVLGWTREVKAAIADRLPLCVTLPGHLGHDEQLDLALRLQAAGADLLQCEALRPTEPDPDLVELTPALARTAELRRVLEVPLLFAGDLPPHHAAFATSLGANGVEVGSALTDLETLAEKEALLHAIKAALSGARLERAPRELALR